MLDQCSVQYPNVFRLIQIMLSTSPNTSLVEWEYTDQMVAAERRNHLSKENLKALVLFDALKLTAKNIPETLKYWMSSGVSLTSWGEGASLALFSHSFSDDITIKIFYGADVLLHRPASHPIFSYWVG